MELLSDPFILNSSFDRWLYRNRNTWYGKAIYYGIVEPSSDFSSEHEEELYGFDQNVRKLANVVNDFNPFGLILREGYHPIFVNKTNTKRIRFDVKNPHDDSPHAHVEIKVGKRWRDYTGQHRIYLKKAPTPKNSPIMNP